MLDSSHVDGVIVLQFGRRGVWTRSLSTVAKNREFDRACQSDRSTSFGLCHPEIAEWRRPIIGSIGTTLAVWVIIALIMSVSKDLLAHCALIRAVFTEGSLSWHSPCLRLQRDSDQVTGGNEQCSCWKTGMGQATTSRWISPEK